MRLENVRPIIVLGCPRSGTTMLQVMLHSHPRIAIPPEIRFLLPTYIGRRKYGDLRQPDNRRRLADDIVQGRITPGATGVASDETKNRFRDLKLDPDEVTEAIVGGPPTVGSALAIVLQLYAKRFGKPRWGDKRPAYHRCLPFIQRMFPDAQIIQIVRDGRACVASLKRMPWWQRDVYTAAAEWAIAYDNCQRFARQLPADTFYQVKYEDLVDDPETELTKLCAFLGEEYDPAMSHPADTARMAVPKRKTWHAATRSDVDASQVDKWREELDPWEIELCETVLGDRLRSYGYTVDGPANIGAKHRMTYRWRKARLQLHTSRLLVSDRLRLLAENRQVANLTETPSTAPSTSSTRS